MEEETFTKICTKCKIEQDYNEFSIWSKAKDGRKCQCKTCTNAYQKIMRDRKRNETNR